MGRWGSWEDGEVGEEGWGLGIREAVSGYWD